MSNNLQRLHYSELSIESGVDNRWKSAVPEGRMVQNRRQRCQSTLWFLASLLQPISCNRKDAANQVTILVKSCLCPLFDFQDPHEEPFQYDLWPVVTTCNVEFYPACPRLNTAESRVKDSPKSLL